MLLPNGFDPDPRVHNEAKTLVTAGYKVTIFCWDRDAKYPASEIIDGIRIKRFQIKSTYGRGSSQLAYLLRFWRAAAAHAPAESADIIHAHDFNVLPLGWWLSRKLKLPLIFDAHESYHEMLADNVHPIIKRAIALTELFFVKRVDLLITVGNILEAEYKKRGARNTVVVGNWKRLEDFQFSGDELVSVKTSLGLPSDKLIISYIGYLVRSRGLLQLIEAVRECDRVFLLIGGKGQLESKIRTEVDGVDNINFLGFTKPEKIPILTALSDVVYYGLEDGSGNNRYSAPNKLFEALAAGRAILTGNLGEIGKIVQTNECGIVLDTIDKHQILLAFDRFTDQKTLAFYNDNAKNAGHDLYNWAEAEKILIKCYTTLLQS